MQNIQICFLSRNAPARSKRNESTPKREKFKAIGDVLHVGGTISGLSKSGFLYEVFQHLTGL
jgi:hypothetical protein